MFPSSPPEFAEKYTNSNRCRPSGESAFSLEGVNLLPDCQKGLLSAVFNDLSNLF